jgi:hypothetical protein
MASGITLRALRLVDAKRIGKRHFVQFPKIIFQRPVIETDGNFLQNFGDCVAKRNGTREGNYSGVLQITEPAPTFGQNKLKNGKS